MSDLSKRFEALMARMARTDAQLFRTLGEQNAALRELVEDGQPEATPETKSPVAPLPAASLLPKEESSLQQLKKRFRTLPPARAFLEERLGPPPPGLGRLTWALVQQTIETGQWPAGKSSSSQGKSGSGAMAAMEQRLLERLERMEQRLERLELLLLQVLEQQSGAVPSPLH